MDVAQWQCTGMDVVSFLCQLEHLCFLQTKFEQPALVECVPAHGRDVGNKGSLRSFPVQAILWLGERELMIQTETVQFPFFIVHARFGGCYLLPPQLNLR